MSDSPVGAGMHTLKLFDLRGNNHRGHLKWDGAAREKYSKLPRATPDDVAYVKLLAREVVDSRELAHRYRTSGTSERAACEKIGTQIAGVWLTSNRLANECGNVLNGLIGQLQHVGALSKDLPKGGIRTEVPLDTAVTELLQQTRSDIQYLRDALEPYVNQARQKRKAPLKDNFPELAAQTAEAYAVRKEKALIFQLYSTCAGLSYTQQQEVKAVQLAREAEVQRELEQRRQAEADIAAREAEDQRRCAAIVAKHSIDQEPARARKAAADNEAARARVRDEAAKVLGVERQKAYNERRNKLIEGPEGLRSVPQKPPQGA